MTIFSLADHYTVWTKSTVINILSTFGDTDFKRSDSLNVLLEHLEGYFVPDVIEAAEAKDLTQLANAAGLLRKGRKYKRAQLVSLLTTFQHTMKEQALDALQKTPEDSEEFTAYVRIIVSTDPELYAQLENELKDD